MSVTSVMYSGPSEIKLQRGFHTVSLQDFRSFSITRVSSIYLEGVFFVKSQHSFLDSYHLTIFFQHHFENPAFLLEAG